MKKFLISLLASGLLIGVGISITFFEVSGLEYDVKYLNSNNQSIVQVDYNFMLQDSDIIEINSSFKKENIIQKIDSELKQDQIKFVIEYDENSMNHYVYENDYGNNYTVGVNIDDSIIFSSIKLIFDDIKNKNIYSYNVDFSKAKLYIYTGEDNKREIFINYYN